MDVLGGVIEKEMGSSLGDAVACLVTQPLGLQDTAFHLSDRRRVAVPYKSGSDNPERMQAEDFVESPTGMIRFANERIFDPLSYHSGGGGMAGTAGDILAILEVIRKGGAPLLHRETVEVMIQDQSHGLMSAERPGQGFGIGWAVVTDPVKAALPYSRGTIQWGGVYGHSWFVDREKAITVVMLTNTAPEGLFGRYATDVRDAVYAALD
jgi:CubicO group peptidase (beta-lactamase class C family)